MFKHFPVVDGLAVVIRTPFRLRANKDGIAIPDRKTGEAVYTAEAVAGGLLRSAFADQDQAGQLRLKVTGTQPPEFQPGAIVQVHDAHLSAWYQPRQRGAEQATSSATLSAGRVSQAHGVAPVMSGGLPGHDRGITALLLSVGEVCEVMYSPEGIFAVDGVGQVRPRITPAIDMIGQVVTLVDARVFYTVPDAADVGRTAKAELIIRCAAIERAVQANGRSRSKPEPSAEQVPAES